MRGYSIFNNYPKWEVLFINSLLKIMAAKWRVDLAWELVSIKARIYDIAIYGAESITKPDLGIIECVAPRPGEYTDQYGKC